MHDSIFFWRLFTPAFPGRDQDFGAFSARPMGPVVYWTSDPESLFNNCNVCLDRNKYNKHKHISIYIYMYISCQKKGLILQTPFNHAANSQAPKPATGPHGL